MTSEPSPAALDDREWAAFSERGPWVLDRGRIEWLDGTDQRRAVSRAEVPSLTSAGRWPGSRALTVSARMLGALAPWWWTHRAPWRTAPDQSESRADVSLRLRTAAEALGPTYIKLGQIVSSGEGLFPSELVAEFKRCRDQVPAEPFEVVRRTVEADLGARIDDVFDSFDRVPLAAASIAQVHAATLRGGTEVVVKVQRPDVAKLVRSDLRAMAWLAPHLIGRIPVAALANPPAIVELFAETVVEELDFRLEAANMLDIATILRELDQTGYVVPRPHPTLVTERVLVMERLRGFNFDDVTSIRAAGIDTENVIRTGMIAFMEGAMVYGVFHGDLHGGNLFVLPDGRTALLDFGIVGRLSDQGRQAFLRLMLSSITNDVRGQVSAMRDLGALPADTDIDAVIRDLRLDQAMVDPTTLSGEQMVREVQRVVKAMLGYGARLPKELVLYVKNLVFLDGAIARLAPDLDLLAEVGNISMVFAQRHGERLGRELGIDPNAVTFDFDGVKASMGLDASTDSFTYRDLQARRQLIHDRVAKHARRGRRRNAD